jgi:hypothetical protein
MLGDSALHSAGEPRAWAPVHAWRALAQLRATDAIAPLLTVLDTVDDDWVSEDVPRALAVLGEAIVEPIAAYLADDSKGLFSRAGASEALVRLATTSPSMRGPVIDILTNHLSRLDGANADLNSFIVSDLVELDAVEAVPAIERAFAADVVEWEVCGDWEDVQVDLGLLAARRTVRPPYTPRPGSQLAVPRPRTQTGGSPHLVARLQQHAKAKKKTKTKHRMAKASRRRNRRR